METNQVPAKPRIAIIEDDKPLRDAMALFLRMMEWSVETFGSGEETSGVVNWEDFAAVLSNFLLPGEDGLSVLRRVRMASDTVGTVLITAKRGGDVSAQASAAGVDRILYKPFSTKELEESLQALHCSNRKPSSSGRRGAVVSGKSGGLLEQCR